MNLPETTSSSPSLSSIAQSTVTVSPLSSPLRSAASSMTKSSVSSVISSASVISSSSSASVRPGLTGLPGAKSESRTSTQPLKLTDVHVPTHGRLMVNPVGAKQESARDSDVKKNLLDMISKSEDRRKKRVLPQVLHLKSPTGDVIPKPLLPALKTSSTEQSKPSPPLSPTGGNIESLKPEASFSLSIAPEKMSEKLASLPLSRPTNGKIGSTENLKSETFPPFSPRKTTSTETQILVLSSPTTEKITEHSSFRAGKMPPTENSKPMSLTDMKVSSIRNLKPGVSLPLSSEAWKTTAKDGDPRLEALSSEMMHQTPEENSSASETEIRNLVPLSLEIEKKSDSQPQKNDRHECGSNDESTTGSGNSITSLPTILDHVSGGPTKIPGPTNLEEVVATSLPDLYHVDNPRCSVYCICCFTFVTSIVHLRCSYKSRSPCLVKIIDSLVNCCLSHP